AAPGREASGNPAGLLRPALHREDTAIARLSRAALGYTMRHLSALADEGRVLPWRRSGVLRLARDTQQAERFAEIARANAFPEDFARCVDTAEAARIAGREEPGTGGGLPLSGRTSPAAP